MELRFLGQTYYSFNLPVETVPSDLTVCFRGQRYKLRVSKQNFKSTLNMGIYRGVRYCKSKS